MSFLEAPSNFSLRKRKNKAQVVKIEQKQQSATFPLFPAQPKTVQQLICYNQGEIKYHKRYY